MLGSRRNRVRHGGRACTYGCCNSPNASKVKVRRIMRRRERRAWQTKAGLR